MPAGLLLLLIPVARGALPQRCERSVFCNIDILQVVEEFHLFNDSKTLLDKSLIRDPEEIEEYFESILEGYRNEPNVTAIEEFVWKSFDTGIDINRGSLPDWEWKPDLVNKFNDTILQAWVIELNYMWRDLCKKMPREANWEPERFSIMHLPHPFIVTGGRLREMHYWDSYWIIRGLLVCDMTEMVKWTLKNLLHLLQESSFVPAASRIYYKDYSQPPLLTMMVYEYFKSTNDVEFVKENIKFLEEEFNFWIDNKNVSVKRNGKEYTFVRYFARSETPRLEFFREDTGAAKTFKEDKEKRQFYVNLKAAAESGWNLSSRWIIRDGTNEGTITDISTTNIVPVDLNAFIYRNAELLSNMYDELNDTEKADHYMNISYEWKEAVTAVLWNNKRGAWFDYDLKNKKQREYFYASNLVPLWTECYDESERSKIAKKVTKYVNETIMEHSLGGIPSSLYETGLQWDYPNAWAPMQHIIIEGLHRTRDNSAQGLATTLLERWLNSTRRGFLQTHEVYEKYDVTTPGRHGQGENYTAQASHAPTVGTILTLISEYAGNMTADDWK